MNYAEAVRLLRKGRCGVEDWNRRHLSEKVPILSGADLRGSNLQGVNLVSSRLKFADFRGADLRGGRLDNADLSYADFSNAQLEGVTMANALLHGALGLSAKEVRETPGEEEAESTLVPKHRDPHSLTPKKYDAFLSYKRQPDERIASALQKALQSLARPWLKWRAMRVFRDITSIPAGPNLGAALRQRLKNSEYLILLACPEAFQPTDATPNPTWVEQEILYWLNECGGPKRMLIARTAGEIHWDASASDFDWRKTTALPKSVSGLLRTEPSVVDLTWTRHTDNQTRLTLTDPVFANATAAMAEPIHGKDREELFSEDGRQRKKAILFRNITVSGLIALLIVAFYLWHLSDQRRIAVERKNLELLTKLEQLDVTMSFRAAPTERPKRELPFTNLGYVVQPPWFSIVTRRTQSVVVVKEASKNQPIGSGFIISGGMISTDWTGKTFVVTASHVIRQFSLKDVEFAIPGIHLDRNLTIQRVEWESPENDFDCAVLSIKGGLPPGVQPFTELGELPAPPKGQKFSNHATLSILGYQQRSDFTYSLHKHVGSGEHGLNEVEKGLRTPVLFGTAEYVLSPERRKASIVYSYGPDPGSSGGPVFNADTGELIAIAQLVVPGDSNPIYGLAVSMAAVRGKIQEDMKNASRKDYPE